VATTQYNGKNSSFLLAFLPYLLYFDCLQISCVATRVHISVLSGLCFTLAYVRTFIHSVILAKDMISVLVLRTH
jgi:hypothetical protein